jgi:hypothetical protein
MRIPHRQAVAAALMATAGICTVTAGVTHQRGRGRGGSAVFSQILCDFGTRILLKGVMKQVPRSGKFRGDTGLAASSVPPGSASAATLWPGDPRAPGWNDFPDEVRISGLPMNGVVEVVP